MSKRNGTTKTITKTSELVSPRELLERSLKTCEREIEKIERISMSDAQIPLVPEFASMLVNYAKTLVMVDKNKKEFPEDNEDDELKNLSDAELAELAKQIILGKKK
jgi:ribosome-binding ATPase YchF (GTP1/OBG family)